MIGTHTKAQHCCRCLDCSWVSSSLNTFWPSPITIENSACWHTTLYRFVFGTWSISTWWAKHPVSFSSSKRALKANTDMWRPSLSCWMVSWFLKVKAHVATKQGLLPGKSSKIPSVILYRQPPGELLVVRFCWFWMLIPSPSKGVSPSLQVNSKGLIWLLHNKFVSKFVTHMPAGGREIQCKKVLRKNQEMSIP